MGNIYINMIIFAFYMRQEADSALAVHKYVHQTDLSEHCKRRVVPSVFIGNQVMEANSHVMHFSQLEVPYSCFLSIRAESGFNVILAVELLSEYSLVESCSKNQDQLIVYELGETFGGYWGPQPEKIMKPQIRNYTQFYSLKTTPAVNTERSQIYKDVTQKILKQTYPDPTDKEPDYIRMEVPLVNVSGNLQLVGPLRHTYNAEEMFDFIYDVTPRNGVEYETSIMPLVQFSIRSQNTEYNDGKPRYELDYDVRSYTKDFGTMSGRVSSKNRNWYYNRRHNYGNRKHPYLINNTTYNYPKFITRWHLSSSSYTTIKSTLIPTLESKYSTLSWNHINDIIKYLNVTFNQSTHEESTTQRNFLQYLTNMYQNLSVYLIPNVSTYYNKFNYIKTSGNVKQILNPKPITNMDMQPIVKSSNTLTNTKYKNSRKVTFDLDNSKSFPSKISSTSKATFVYDKEQSIVPSLKNQTKVYNSFEKNKLHKINVLGIKGNLQTQNRSKEIETVTKSLRNNNTLTSLYLLQTGTMVGHESWDNIVQAAPVMAVVLNKTNLFSNNKNTSNTDRENSVKHKRKKRYIQSLQIENSRPRNLTTKRAGSTERGDFDKVSDIHDLARLVELQDDEIEGRIALRYLRNYVGSVLLNICDFSEPKARQTFLFNASRIVIALNNFTLDRLMLVATPARTLLHSMSICPPGYLECQVVGTRMCIDSTNSCDGVPNCGSYDIYDEDRLLCGTSKDLQFNIYLAALTFLAVLLTMLYVVYYWLKRCVPRVSEAFFVYTDVSENTLFLDPIMRSPTDVDDASCKIVFSGDYFDDDLDRGNIKSDANKNSCVNILRRFCELLLLKRKRKEKEDTIKDIDAQPSRANKIFSYTELELRKYAPIVLKDEAIQTIQNYEDIENHERNNKVIKDSLSKDKFTYKDDSVKELNLMKFANETRSTLSQNDSFMLDKKYPKFNRRFAIDAGDETEIRSTVYDNRSNKNPSMYETKLKTFEVHTERPKEKVDTKRLRFEEAPTMISVIDSEEDIVATNLVRRNVVLSRGHMNKKNVNKITEAEEPGSANKDNMRFWGAKSKKCKNKDKNVSDN